MRKFLSPSSLASFPPEFASESSGEQVDQEWRYHNWLGFSTPNKTWRPLCPKGIDHVYNLGRPKTTEEYAQAAQVAQLTQFQSLFEGFLEHLWAYYSAVVMWKSQSPWPVFRGAFYDSWLAPTGGFYGVRRALGGGSGVQGKAHIQLNLKTWTPSIVVRGPSAVEPTRTKISGKHGGRGGSGLGGNVTMHVVARMYTLEGVEAAPPTMWDLPQQYAESIPGQTVVTLDTPLLWPGKPRNPERNAVRARALVCLCTCYVCIV